jgi:hypothetical protein
MMTFKERYKNAEFHAHFKSVERVLKKYRKVISKTSFTTTSKSEKRVRRDSVGCGVISRVRRGSAGCGVAQIGCGVAQIGCGMAQ